uniref:Cytochrome c oxidase assembly factor 7 n=1 Tax=Syphacia muris TaxID=451379 RepID=A0A0N5ARL8_9BILA
MDKNSREQLNAEARDYVYNLDLEFKFGCFKEHNADLCHQHGEFLESVQNNFADAFKIFKENCEQRKHPDSCLKYAKYMISDKERKAGANDIEKSLITSCEGAVPRACHYLSLFYYKRDGDKCKKKVEEYMKRACELHYGRSCWLLGAWYLGPVEGVEFVNGKKVRVNNVEVVERDAAKALNYGIMGCELGVPQACSNVSRMYEIGDGIEKDSKKAKDFKERARKFTRT